MLRDLATVLEDLHEALQGYGRMAQAGVLLTRADLTLPMDFTAILRDGSCVLLADVSRARADAVWLEQASRLKLVWELAPVSDYPVSDYPVSDYPVVDYRGQQR